MAKHDDNVVPNERREARRWTRVTDYWPGADERGAMHWPRPGSLADYPITPPSAGAKTLSRRGLLWPILAVAAAAILSLWGSGILRQQNVQAVHQSAKSRGLVFGLCSEGGLTNCVASGDSFYLGGKTVRIAGIEAPQLYGAACPKEVALGHRSATTLQQLLNSGEIEMTKVNQDLDRYGLLLRSVSVDGKDVGREMLNAGLARDIGDITRSWC